MTISRRSLLAASVAGFATRLASAETSIEKIDVFEAGQDGYALYRIPGVVVTSLGTVLAYCEGRKRAGGDWGTIDLFMRRSEDGGRSWSGMKKLVELPGPHSKNPVSLKQKLATEGEVTYNNPVAIADRNGSVHFLFCYEYMRAFYMRSDDDGRTFSKPVEITQTFEAFRKDYPWQVLAIGPGHGIQLANGRLIAPVWISPGTGGHAHRPSVTSVIYSDDHGVTWNAGEIAVHDTERTRIPNETAVVELADGGVMLNVRSESLNNRRILVQSQDGATNWSEPKFHEQLVEPICFGSTVRLSTKKNSDRNRMLFSNPDNLSRRDGKEEPGKNRDRRNLTVKLSYDEGESWPVAKVIEPGWSGYSDLGVTKDGTVLCFYERGGLHDNHFQSAALTMARFDLSWLTNGKDKLSKGSGWIGLWCQGNCQPTRRSGRGFEGQSRS